jgi:hypothetical protein
LISGATPRDLGLNLREGALVIRGKSHRESGAHPPGLQFGDVHHHHVGVGFNQAKQRGIRHHFLSNLWQPGLHRTLLAFEGEHRAAGKRAANRHRIHGGSTPQDGLGHFGKIPPLETVGEGPVSSTGR